MGSDPVKFAFIDGDTHSICCATQSNSKARTHHGCNLYRYGEVELVNRTSVYYTRRSPDRPVCPCNSTITQAVRHPLSEWILPAHPNPLWLNPLCRPDPWLQPFAHHLGAALPWAHPCLVGLPCPRAPRVQGPVLPLTGICWEVSRPGSSAPLAQVRLRPPHRLGRPGGPGRLTVGNPAFLW